MTGPTLVLWACAWVGHAAIWVAVLNRFYGRALPKAFLKPYRYATGALVFAFPLLALAPRPDWLGGYLGVCAATAAVAIPVVTARRLLAARRANVGVARESQFRDYYAELGPGIVGDGLMPWATRLPGTDAFVVEFARLTLTLAGLPKSLDGLEILLLTDLHFHGTPARVYFEAVFDRLAAEPPPDLLLLGGDYVDKDSHRAWIAPLVSRLGAAAGKFAVLGNHDTHHDPEAVRAELRAAGCTVLGAAESGGVARLTIRGEPVAIVGDERPWFPGPDHSRAGGGFRIVLAHTPDRFPEAAEAGCDLVLAGHVHGGQIRLPLFGSIFVPSVFGRRYDCGVFRRGKCAMVVSRGLSGKEPLRIRCRPEVIRLRLAAG